MTTVKREKASLLLSQVCAIGGDMDPVTTPEDSDSDDLTRRVYFSLNETDAAALEALARKRRLPVSALVRTIVCVEIEREFPNAT